MNLKQYLPNSLKSFFSFGGTEVSVGDRQFVQLLNLPGAGQRPTLREAVSHALVFACLQRKIEAIQDVVPLIESRSARNEWKADDTHPAGMPLLRPNDQQSWADFFSSLLIDEDVWGRWYVEILRSSRGAIVGLLPLDVRGIREIDEFGASVEVGADFFWNAIPLGRVVRYEVVDSRRTRNLLPENILSYRTFDVRSPLAGMSRVLAALRAVGLEKSFATYINTYLQSGGPAHVLRFKDKTLTEEQGKLLQEKWDKNYSLGGKRAGKTAILDQGGELQTIGAHLGDLAADTIGMKEQADICAAMGVPGQLVSAYFAIRWGNQRAGQESALRQFWELWGTPTVNRYGNHLTRFYLSEFEPSRAGKTLRVRLDTSAIKALQEDGDKKAARSRADYQAGICSLNEARTAQGLQPVPGGDEIGGLLKQEAARLALEQQQTGQTEDDDSKPPQKPGKSQSEPSEAKAYDWEGLKLSRKPTELERKILKQVASAQNTAQEQLFDTLSKARLWLIADGLKKLVNPPDGGWVLTLPKSFEDDIYQQIGSAFDGGAATVMNAKKAAWIKIIARITEYLIVALVNQVTARLVSEHSRRRLRGVTAEEAAQQTEFALRDESLTYIEDLASGAAYEAVGQGRGEAMEIVAQPGDRWLYSAILDTNTCTICKEADLKEATERKLLPSAPNLDCKGRWRCRCMHILVRD